jgi:hypothetical protein
MYYTIKPDAAAHTCWVTAAGGADMTSGRAGCDEAAQHPWGAAAGATAVIVVPGAPRTGYTLGSDGGGMFCTTRWAVL